MGKPFQEALFYRTFIVEPHPWIVSNTWVIEAEAETFAKTIHPCRVVCSNYCSNNPYQCSISDDAVEILQMMIKADVLIIGAPLYFRAPPAKFQAFIERLISIFFFFETQGDEVEESPLKGKPCGLIGVAYIRTPTRYLNTCLTYALY